MTPECEQWLLRIDDMRYAMRGKNLTIALKVSEATLRHILRRLRRQRRRAAGMAD